MFIGWIPPFRSNFLLYHTYEKNSFHINELADFSVIQDSNLEPYYTNYLIISILYSIFVSGRI